MLISPPFLPARAANETEEGWLERCMAGDAPGDGAYPLSFNLGWHGGLHLQAPGDGTTFEPVRAMADGVVVHRSPPNPAQPAGPADPALPLYHLYNTGETGVPKRALHWDEAQDAQRTHKWWGLEQRSRQRLADLVAGKDLGVYGLGRERTMAQYAAFCGIDYAARTLALQAYKPLPSP